MRTIPAILTGALLLLSAGLPCWAAGHIVHLTDGRTLEVEKVSMEPSRAIVTLPGGNRMAFPAHRIERILDVEPEPAQIPDPIVPDEAWRTTAGQYAELIAAAAQRHNLDPALLTAMASVESSFNPGAVSPKGAAGLLQLMPATAERFGVQDRFDVHQNVEGGARYMSWLLRRFEGRTDLALAGYNAGEGAVDRHRGVPPYRETRNYVTRVLDRAGSLGSGALTP